MNATFNDQIDHSFAKAVYSLYKQAWWCANRNVESTKAVIDGSTRCFGLLTSTGRLIAFARVLSDGIEKATIYDVIIDEPYRGKGLGKQILKGVLSSSCCKNVRHVELYCKEEMMDYYTTFGFADISANLRLLRKNREI